MGQKKYPLPSDADACLYVPPEISTSAQYSGLTARLRLGLLERLNGWVW